MFCSNRNTKTIRIIKVFIPENLISQNRMCTIYGEVAIEEKSLSYFIITSSEDDSSSSTNQFRKLGEISTERRISQKHIPITVTFNNSTLYIYLTNLGINEIEDAVVEIFLYLDQTILSLNFSWNDEQNDISFLKRLIREKQKITKSPSKKSFILNAFKFFLRSVYNVITRLRSISLVSRILANTAFHDQMNDWSNSMMMIDDRNEERNGQIWTLLFDVSAGMAIMLLFLFCIKPDEYLIETSQDVVIQLRILLESLKGSPVGLKLNEQLNNFLLDCFTYHVNLWATFLITISPIIRYLFVVPIAAFGFLGLSFQLAMLSDLIVLISLHAHCFYIYAAVLYNIEKVGLSALWKVFLGKRKNVLKNRVESYDFMNRQLYLSTMFFTVLLFLLPTILVYYTVFATLRVFIYLMCYTLMKIRRRILEFRIDLFFKWILGNYYDASSIEIQYLDSFKCEQTRSRIPISVLKLNAIKSSWKYVFLRSHCRSQNSDTYMTLKQFMSGILKGEMINFSQVKSNYCCNS